MNPQQNIKLDVNNFGQTIGYPVEGHLPKSLPYAKKITGQYCYLEPLLIKKHVNALYEALCLGQTDDHWTYLPFGPFLSFNEFNLWLEEMALHKMFYVIFDAQDKQAKGALPH